MQCPNDMIPMTVKTWRTLEVWRCPACFRGWFPQEPLVSLSEHTKDRMAHLDIWRDPSAMFYKRSRRNCPEGGTPLYRMLDRAMPVAVEMCNEAHGMLVEETAFRIIGEAVPMPLTAQLAVGLPGEEIFNPRHHAHLAVAHVLAHRLFSNKQHLIRELAKLPT